MRPETLTRTVKTNRTHPPRGAHTQQIRLAIFIDLTEQKPLQGPYPEVLHTGALHRSIDQGSNIILWDAGGFIKLLLPA